MTAPAKAIEIHELDESPESEAEGVPSGVVRRAPDQSGAFESESALAEALTLAARAGRWEVVEHLAALSRYKP